jgi:hypothetical protein
MPERDHAVLALAGSGQMMPSVIPVLRTFSGWTAMRALPEHRGWLTLSNNARS